MAARRRASSPRRPSARPRDGGWSAPFLVPASYLAEHAELGYAGNVFTAQGRTVDNGYLLVSEGMTRDLAYVWRHPRPRAECHVHRHRDRRTRPRPGGGSGRQRMGPPARGSRAPPARRHASRAEAFEPRRNRNQAG